eukprot:jgi/Bigna1/140997/aug1.59_g15705
MSALGEKIPDSPSSVNTGSSKSRQRRTRKDAQLRKQLMSDYGSSTSVLSDRKIDSGNSVVRSGIRKPSSRSTTSTIKRTVLGLRPGKAMTIPCSISVQEAARKMGSIRSDAALVTLNNEVCGIITDSDITRRVVAAGKKASSTPVSLVMTGSPLSMKPSDPAYEAIQTMVDRHFRHMPVMRNKSSIVGLLDINRCLSDAIKRNENNDMMRSGVFSGLKYTLQQVLNRNEEEAPFVLDKDPVIDAAKVMARTRKTAVLVKDSSKSVVGILTTKDIMLRVVAARLMPQSTTVARVMTPHPDTVPCSITVGDALKQMRSKRYLHLPVASAENKEEVVGLVDALELCYIVLKPEKTGKENEVSVNDQGDEISVRSVEGKHSKASSADMLAQVETCITGLERTIREASKSSSEAIEGKISTSMEQATKDIHQRIMNEVGEVKRMITSAKWATGGEEIKLKAIEGSLKTLLKDIAAKMDKLELAVHKQGASVAGGSHTAAAPMSIQPLLEILSKNQSELREQGRTLGNEVASSMTKIERMLSDTNTTLTKLASTSAAMPEIVKSAVARASRPSFGDSVTPSTLGGGKSPDDAKGDVSDTCNRIAFQTVEIVRSKVNSAFDGARHQSTEVINSNTRLANSIEKMNDRLLAKMETGIEARVQAKVEGELLKVAGTSAVAGILLGMLALKLFAPK